MKKCTSCAKDLPDTAMHCVFCGAKQAPAAAPPNPNAKTVLGYSAADLLKQAGIPQAQPAPQAPQGFPPPGGGGFPPPQQFAPPPQAPPQQFAPPPQQFAPPPQAPPQQFAPPAAPQGFPPPGGGGFGGGPPPGFPPPAQGGQFGGSASTAATMFMQNAPQIPQQPAQPMPFSPPPQMQPPQASFPQMPQAQPQPYQPPQQQPYQPPGGMGGMPAPQPYNPMPVGGMPGQPPFLASQTAARADKPVEPFNDAVKLVLLAFGIGLIVFFVTPLTLKPGLSFNWDLILHGGGIAILVPLMVIAGGIFAVVFASMPLAPMARGGLAALLGVIPLVLLLTVIKFDWHGLIGMVGGVLLISGLLLRNEYTRDSLPRIFIAVGAVGTVLPLVIDPTALINIFKAMIEAVLHPNHPGPLVMAIGAFVPILFAVIAIVIAIIPGPHKAGAKAFAWTVLMWPAALTFAAATAGGTVFDVLQVTPGMLLAWVPAVAFSAFASFGVATLFGKQLEMSK